MKTHTHKISPYITAHREKDKNRPNYPIFAYYCGQEYTTHTMDVSIISISYMYPIHRPQQPHFSLLHRPR